MGDTMGTSTGADTPDGAWAELNSAERDRALNEREQNHVRMVFMLVVAPWALSYAFGASVTDGALLLLTLLLYAFSVLYTELNIRRLPRRTRRLWFTVLFDVVLVSVSIWFTQPATSPIYFFYLTIIIGNTVRYAGLPVMLYSAALSLAGYLTVLAGYIVAAGPEEMAALHWELESGKIGAIIIMPFFLRKLLERKAAREAAIHQLAVALERYTIGEDTLTFNLDPGDETAALAHALEALSRAVREKNLALSRQAETLKDQVRERTAELQAQMKRATESDQLKTQFLTNLSHELRTPLHNIIGFTDLLTVREQLTPAAQRMLGIIGQRARELLSTLEKLTDITCLMSGETPFQPAPVNVVELFHETVERYRAEAESRSIALRCDIALERAMYYLDQEVAHKILRELVDNALKFTAEGGSVTVRVAERDGALVLEIHDTGGGIAESQRGPIFELFRQADGGLNRRHEGLGVGLYMVKLLAMLHGGGVRLDSEPGKGTTFTVTLPAKRMGMEELRRG